MINQQMNLFQSVVKVGIIGARERNEVRDCGRISTEFCKILEYYKDKNKKVWIVSGGCPSGGDRFAELIAKTRCIPIFIIYADWKTYGKSAGFIRNKDIALCSNILIARVKKERVGGTEDTIKHFKTLNGKDTPPPLILINDLDSEKPIEYFDPEMERLFK